MATKKPATTKPQKTAPPTEPVVWDPNSGDIDASIFDTWDEAAEEAAIALAAEVAAVKTVIIEGKIFAGRFPDGTIIKAPLTFSVADLEAITSIADNPVDQIKELFRVIGEDESVTELEQQNLASVVIYAERFFGTFEKITKTALGKSLAS
ncbi:hypothetical protein [Leucobacter tenebrionis]|uniref:hypothetical protein n=1 Tax=Leucobacter tenebrionis TaxID=2873270 RepID=UPI001CA70161|nr:hypothetical protein [Leucobacter tenebrionis]QZY52923.1 hypothetical protein KVY00_05675 [Leucobacter tenebrionis]